MILKPKYHAPYMRMALALAELSQCRRLKVGALLIRLTSEGVPCILAEGVNGTPVGQDNCCETDETLTQTKDAVVHAEVSVLTKMKEFAIPSYPSVLVITDSPCAFCAAAILRMGVREVYYHRKYRLPDGLNRLDDFGIKHYHIEEI